MGKKLSQATPKISKNDGKQQFNSLIKVLRPKVYITHPSSFKKLVQELTGNGSSTIAASSSPPPPLEPQVFENCTIRESDHQVLRDLETSLEVSVSTGTNSSELCYTPLMNEEEFNQASNYQICLEDTVFEDSVKSQNLDTLAYQNLETSVEVLVSTEETTKSSELCYTPLMNEDFDQVSNQIWLEDTVFEGSVGYQNLESLLFDAEPNHFFNCYAQIEQEVSIYDYELSGLI